MLDWQAARTPLSGYVVREESGHDTRQTDESISREGFRENRQE